MQQIEKPRVPPVNCKLASVAVVRGSRKANRTLGILDELPDTTVQQGTITLSAAIMLATRMGLPRRLFALTQAASWKISGPVCFGKGGGCDSAWQFSLNTDFFDLKGSDSYLDAEGKINNEIVIDLGIQTALAALDLDALEFSPVYRCLVDGKSFSQFNSECSETCPAEVDVARGQCV